LTPDIPRDASAPARQCGGCTACCKTHEIRALAKPPGQWCPHCLPGQGCAIYGERPEECRSYGCLWLAGYGPDRIRPDLSRVVLGTVTFTVRGKPIELITMNELTPGSIAKPAGQEIVQQLLKGGAILLQWFLQYSPPRAKFIIPPARQAEATVAELDAAMHGRTQPVV
jgi:hypothetical protein